MIKSKSSKREFDEHFEPEFDKYFSSAHHIEMRNFVEDSYVTFPKHDELCNRLKLEDDLVRNAPLLKAERNFYGFFDYKESFLHANKLSKFLPNF